MVTTFNKPSNNDGQLNNRQWNRDRIGRNDLDKRKLDKHSSNEYDHRHKYNYNRCNFVRRLTTSLYFFFLWESIIVSRCGSYVFGST